MGPDPAAGAVVDARGAVYGVERAHGRGRVHHAADPVLEHSSHDTDDRERIAGWLSE